jgi:hypothetical protein
MNAVIQHTLHASEHDTDKRIERVVATQLEKVLEPTFAKLAAIYFPPPPAPPLPTALPTSTSVLVHSSRLRGLRTFLKDDDALFRSPQQGEVVEKMIAREAPLLCITRCDFGKTMLFQLVVKEFDQGLVAIVIEPLSGLQSDFHRRGVESGLRLRRWDDGPIQVDSVDIVYVSIELAGSTKFIRYAQINTSQFCTNSFKVPTRAAKLPALRTDYFR